MYKYVTTYVTTNYTGKHEIKNLPDFLLQNHQVSFCLSICLFHSSHLACWAPYILWSRIFPTNKYGWERDFDEKEWSLGDFSQCGLMHMDTCSGCKRLLCWCWNKKCIKFVRKEVLWEFPSDIWVHLIGVCPGCCLLFDWSIYVVCSLDFFMFISLFLYSHLFMQHTDGSTWLKVWSDELKSGYAYGSCCKTRKRGLLDTKNFLFVYQLDDQLLFMMVWRWYGCARREKDSIQSTN